MAETKQRKSSRVRPIVVISLVSLVLCGLAFPIIVTGVAQLAFPYQANGELQALNGRTVGSLIAVNQTDYTQPVFFHLRNDSASGFDPDITLGDAQSQIPRISNSTGISTAALNDLVTRNVQGVWWVFGSPYVNVQKLNLLLVNEFPSVYSKYLG
jgi:K+-transporting ATPase ATPase C chain